ncbi:MAG TPA: hypothetical protein VF702_02075 [Allosphingosinicella sp.]|jgi:hypothetical protein
MPDLKTMRGGAVLAAGALAISSCSGGEPQPDPAAIDAHLNKFIADEEIERRRLVEEARQREDVRENEMDAREENYTNSTE